MDVTLKAPAQVISDLESHIQELISELSDMSAEKNNLLVKYTKALIRSLHKNGFDITYSYGQVSERNRRWNDHTITIKNTIKEFAVNEQSACEIIQFIKDEMIDTSELQAIGQ